MPTMSDCTILKSPERTDNIVHSYLLPRQHPERSTRCILYWLSWLFWHLGTQLTDCWWKCLTDKLTKENAWHFHCLSLIVHLVLCGNEPHLAQHTETRYKEYKVQCGVLEPFGSLKLPHLLERLLGIRRLFSFACFFKAHLHFVCSEDQKGEHVYWRQHFWILLNFFIL